MAKKEGEGGLEGVGGEEGEGGRRRRRREEKKLEGGSSRKSQQRILHMYNIHSLGQTISSHHLPPTPHHPPPTPNHPPPAKRIQKVCEADDALLRIEASLLIFLSVSPW